MFYDEDGDSFCGHPFTHSKPPKNKKEWEQTSTALLVDECYLDCPLNEHMKIFHHIERMFENFCSNCDGSGKIWTHNIAPLLDFVKVDCPECKGTGIKTEEQRAWEEQKAKEVYELLQKRHKEGESDV